MEKHRNVSLERRDVSEKTSVRFWKHQDVSEPIGTFLKKHQDVFEKTSGRF